MLYEEVELYRPPVSRPRPVVLVGMYSKGCSNSVSLRVIPYNTITTFSIDNVTLSHFLPITCMLNIGVSVKEHLNILNHIKNWLKHLPM